MIIHTLFEQKKIHPPAFVVHGLQYATIMGSEAYGVSSGSSDVDVYGFCIPDKGIVFPHLSGEIAGFGTQIQRFNQWQETHIKGENGKEFDFSIYNIVQYFHLAMTGSPNITDSLFTPQRCVMQATSIGQIVREKRKIFLSKKHYHTLKGFAYSQISKIKNKSTPLTVFMKKHRVPNDVSLVMIEDSICHFLSDLSRAVDPLFHLDGDRLEELKGLFIKYPPQNSLKRRADVVEHGYSLKESYHVVRLLSEIEQILEEGDLDLERNREQLKSIRRGEWTFEQIEDWFTAKEKKLETVYTNSKLKYAPDEDEIKELLMNCLEQFYGNLDSAVARNPDIDVLLRDLKLVMSRFER